MAVRVESMEEKRIIEQMHILIQGPFKGGKSWLAATAKDPILFIDVDLRADSLAGFPGVFTISPMDSPGLNRPPERYNEILKIVGRLEETHVLGKIHPKFASHPRAHEEIKTVVADSLLSISDAIDDWNMYTNPKALAREIFVGMDESVQVLRFASGWDTWNADIMCVDKLISRICSIHGLDFILTCHEELTKDGRWGPSPRRYIDIFHYFNDVWRIDRNSNIPELQLEPTWQFKACTTFVGAPATVTNPNIKQLLSKYGRRDQQNATFQSEYTTISPTAENIIGATHSTANRIQA